MNRKNLRKLANYLLNLPEDYKHFHMGDYLTLEGSYYSARRAKEIINYCGTAGCAIGHAPLIKGLEAGNEYWSEYTSRVFGVDEFKDARWRWAFHPDWSAVDNTPQGAALRILYMLDFDVPKRFGYSSQSVKKYTNAYDVVTV